MWLGGRRELPPETGPHLLGYKRDGYSTLSLQGGGEKNIFHSAAKRLGRSVQIASSPRFISMSISLTSFTVQVPTLRPKPRASRTASSVASVQVGNQPSPPAAWIAATIEPPCLIAS